MGVRRLTLYAFSEQNWLRPDEEVSSLMELLSDFLVSEREELLEKKIRLSAIGRLDKLPEIVRRLLEMVCKDVGDDHEMELCLALSYGGREEIVDAARVIAERVESGALTTPEINEAMLAAELPSMQGGPVDLLIRTGGEQRVSNFLLWGAAYAEYHFTDCLWPDFQDRDLEHAFSEFAARERRFGRIVAVKDKAVGS